MHFLVVEDDFVCRRALLAYLQDYGKVDIATDGCEAVEAVRLALDEGQRFDLVCLDINMPNMDGQQALREIRRLEEGQGIMVGDGAKVLMTTALDDAKNVFKAFRESADGYLVKPIKRDALIEKLREFGLLLRA